MARWAGPVLSTAGSTHGYQTGACGWVRAAWLLLVGSSPSCTLVSGCLLGPWVQFSVGLSDLEPKRKDRSLAAAAWLKQSSSQGCAFGTCSEFCLPGRAGGAQWAALHSTLPARGKTAPLGREAARSRPFAFVKRASNGTGRVNWTRGRFYGGVH